MLPQFVPLQYVGKVTLQFVELQFDVGTVTLQEVLLQLVVGSVMLQLVELQFACGTVMLQFVPLQFDDGTVMLQLVPLQWIFESVELSISFINLSAKVFNFPMFKTRKRSSIMSSLVKIISKNSLREPDGSAEILSNN